MWLSDVTHVYSIFFNLDKAFSHTILLPIPLSLTFQMGLSSTVAYIRCKQYHYDVRVYIMFKKIFLREILPLNTQLSLLCFLSYKFHSDLVLRYRFTYDFMNSS